MWYRSHFSISIFDFDIRKGSVLTLFEQLSLFLVVASMYIPYLFSVFRICCPV